MSQKGASTGCKGVLLVDHGSRRQASNEQLAGLASRLAEVLDGCDGICVVRHAHMELSEPTIAQAFAACVARGADRIVVVPCFLSRGRHVTSDIPELLKQASDEHPGVTYSVAPPLSEQPGFVSLLSSAALSCPEE